MIRTIRAVIDGRKKEALEQLRLEPEFQPNPEPEKKSFFSRVKDAFTS